MPKLAKMTDISTVCEQAIKRAREDTAPWYASISKTPVSQSILLEHIKQLAVSVELPDGREIGDNPVLFGKHTAIVAVYLRARKNDRWYFKCLRYVVNRKTDTCIAIVSTVTSAVKKG